MAYLIAKVPENVLDRAASLEEIACAGEVCGEMVHIFPPSLSSKERGAYRSTECGSRGQETNLGVVGIGVEHVVGHACGHVEVGHLLEHLPVLIPGQGETGETLRSHSGLAVEVGG